MDNSTKPKMGECGACLRQALPDPLQPSAHIMWLSCKVVQQEPAEAPHQGDVAAAICSCLNVSLCLRRVHGILHMARAS